MCPNYIPPKSQHYCNVCDEPILNGEEYIVNDYGEHMHYDCIQGTRGLLSWLGYDVKYMENEHD